METLIKTNKEVTIHHLTEITSPLPEYFQKVSSNFESSICIFSIIDKIITGYCILTPLYSKSTSKKQAIFISDFWANDYKSAEDLISEGIKHSWEIGCHVAFTALKHPSIFKVGFESNSEFKINTINTNKISAMELSWNGFSKISNLLSLNNSFNNIQLN
jgi:hypothetical protein